MPREQINFPSTKMLMINDRGEEREIEPGAELPDGSKLVADPELSVSWMPDGHVQVSINMEAEFIKHLSTGMTEGATHNAVYTPSLSRQEINKLIRVLRLARDKAYGRDE
jgi:hypothetical protein